MTRGEWNVRATVVWALLAMLALAVAFALELGPIIGTGLVVLTGVLHDLLARWLIGPPPRRDPS